MEDHTFPAAERIINDIGLIFKKDPKLKDFQILPVTLNENRSPVHHVNNCLGLESWCVPHVYCYAYNLLMDIRQQKRRREDAEYVNHLLMGALLLNPEVSVMWNMRREMSTFDPQAELHFTFIVLCVTSCLIVSVVIDAEYVNHLLMGALLLNPEVSVMWNMRREMSTLDPQAELYFTFIVLCVTSCLIVSVVVDAEYVNHLLMGALLLNPEVSVMWNMRREMSTLDPQAELHFTSVVLTRKPKSAEVFNYRKWLIKKLMNVYPCDPGLVTSEVHACQLAAELYPNNYYAWNHRIWCLELLPTDSGSYVSFLVSEWMATHKWVSSHISDHSGFQYRQHLLQKFVNLPPAGYSTVRKCTTDIEQSATSSLQMFLTSAENKRSDFLTETTKTILTESLGNKCEKVESIPLGLILSELLFNTDLIFVYPGHEAIWYHRRFLLHLLREGVNNLRLEGEEHKDNNGVSLEKAKRMESVGDSLVQRVVRFETVLYSKCRVEKDRQASYAEKHRAWLASIMKINLNLPVR